MIDRQALLKDLQKLTLDVQEDIRSRCQHDPDLEIPLRAEYTTARSAERTAEDWDDWRDDLFLQAAVHWVLACVFVRFLEDNGLIAHPNDPSEPPFLSGPGRRRQYAVDRHSHYFQLHPKDSDRDYLLHVFSETARLPAMKALFDNRHNPVWRIAPTGDGAGRILGLWTSIDPSTGLLRHDFSDPGFDTRFLGDLYQDLSKAARDKYALLQTPIFVEEFILDRTLKPAIEVFGWQAVRVIDPTCGSGHFLLGAFARLLELWQGHEPGLNPGDLVQRALDGVYGVDLNPFAVAIARFRLLIAALHAAGIHKLKDAPGFRMHLATGDSLLHGKRWQIGTSNEAAAGTQKTLDAAADPLQHVYATEDRGELARILGQQYHAVVGNPPYITVKDKALNKAYRSRYDSCHMKYSLAIPFMERFFELAVAGEGGGSAGFVGMITANSFMKREFGSRLIERLVPKWDLTHVIDTSGAYIPGHGTPTAILFGRHQRPVAETVRASMGIRGEPMTPDDPSQGLVWSAILSQLEQPGSQSAYVSVADIPRVRFHKHPWPVGGGGAAELTEVLTERANRRLKDVVASIGFMAITGEDDFFVRPRSSGKALGERFREFVIGVSVRDWCIDVDAMALFPYLDTGRLEELEASSVLWPFRTALRSRSMFGKSPEEHGFHWAQYLQLIRARRDALRLIAFPEVASHNHFVLDRGGKLFNQTAPVIKLRAEATDEDHFALLGLLNSSVVCFLMKQVAHQKQMTGGDGVRVDSRAKVPYQFSGTQLRELPVCDAAVNDALGNRVRVIARRIDEASRRRSDLSASHAISAGLADGPVGMRRLWQEIQTERALLRRQMIGLQEELDFTVYSAYGLCSSGLLDDRALEREFPSLDAGVRPFCLIRHSNDDGFAVPAELPREWPRDLREIWERRMAAIESSPELAIIEDAHYKRRWIGRQGLFNRDRGRDELEDAALEWLLDRLEATEYWPAVEPQSTARLADRAHSDTQFMQVAELYRGRADFDLTALVTEVVVPEAVPHLPVSRYSAAGLAKRARWERTWELQRREDAIAVRAALPINDPMYLTEAEANRRMAAEVGDIPVPPKFASADFLKGDYSRLRGKLDVPKERFILYPHAEREADPTPVVGWAGWDHLQRAQALATYYLAMRDKEGWAVERLTPLLAGLLDLVPWLRQWHNAIDPSVGQGLGDYYAGFAEEEMRRFGLTAEAVRAWTPSLTTSKPRGRGRRAEATLESGR